MWKTHWSTDAAALAKAKTAAKELIAECDLGRSITSLRDWCRSLSLVVLSASILKKSIVKILEDLRPPEKWRPRVVTTWKKQLVSSHRPFKVKKMISNHVVYWRHSIFRWKLESPGISKPKWFCLAGKPTSSSVQQGPAENSGDYFMRPVFGQARHFPASGPFCQSACGRIRPVSYDWGVEKYFGPQMERALWFVCRPERYHHD